MPTEVQALSSQFSSGWEVTTGNDIGTVSSQLTHPTRQPSDLSPSFQPCCETLPDTHTCQPTPVPTPLPTLLCPDGEEYDASSVSCSLCPVGRTTNHSDGIKACELCPAGKRGD